MIKTQIKNLKKFSLLANVFLVYLIGKMTNSTSSQKLIICFFLQLTKQIKELTAEKKKLVKTLTDLREKFDATVAENSKRGNLIQDLKEEVKVNFLANQVCFKIHFQLNVESNPGLFCFWRTPSMNNSFSSRV